MSLLDQIENVLANNKVLSTQYGRPRTDASKAFVNNMELISNQLYVKNQSIAKVSKHLKVEKSKLKTRVRQYLGDDLSKVEAFNTKNENSEKVNLLLSNQLQAYLNNRYGLHTTLKMMIDYLKSYFTERVEEHKEIGFTLNMINRPRVTKLLKDQMAYSYKSHYIRPPAAFSLKLMENRMVFPQTIENLVALGFNIIYVDECTIATDNLSTKTWVKKGSYVPLVRPTDKSINTIAAYIMKGKYAFMLKRGSTTSEHISIFFDKLHELLGDQFDERYAFYTVFVLDNAKVHISSTAKSYFKSKSISVLTLPPYTPEYNKGEGVFNILKMNLKKQNLYMKRLEHIVVDVIGKL